MAELRLFLVACQSQFTSREDKHLIRFASFFGSQALSFLKV